MNTKATKKNEIEERWYVIDATGRRMGQVATAAAQLLLAKNEPLMRDYLMPRNKVIVINADKVDVTAKRREMKIYTKYSGYPGGLSTASLDEMMNKFPTRPMEHAIKGMLPKGRRGRAIYANNLFVFASSEHPHQAQKPVEIDLDKFRI